MKKILFIVLTLSCGVAFSAQKSGGNYFIPIDAINTVVSTAEISGGNFKAQGFIGNTASSFQTVGSTNIESGFYSFLVSTPANFADSETFISSITLNWQNVYNPAGVFYTLRISTSSDLYSYLLEDSTSELNLDFNQLSPNTTYYSFAYSNYMESDYSDIVSTISVTLSSPVNSNLLGFSDIGDKYINFQFFSPENPAVLLNEPSWNSYALPKQIYAHDSLFYSTWVYIAGGYDGVDLSSAVYMADYLPEEGNFSVWRIAGYLPYKIYGHKILASKSRFYLIGGYNQEGVKNKVWSCVISTSGELGVWEEENSLPEPVYLSAVISYNNQIYIFGGFNGTTPLATVYNAQIGDEGHISSWQSLSSMPAPRYAHSAVMVSSNNIMILGGSDGYNAKAEVWKVNINYDGTLSNWKPQYSLPVALYSFSANAASNKIFVVGGNNDIQNINHIFSAKLNLNGDIEQWELEGYVSSFKRLHTSHIFGSKLYVFAGDDNTYGNLILSRDLTGTEYKIDVSENDTFAPLKYSSPWIKGNSVIITDLLPNVTYYFRVTSRNYAGIQAPYLGYISTVTYSAPPIPSGWSVIGTSTLTANWISNSNPDGTEYMCEISSHSDYSYSFSSQTLMLSATFYDLLPNTTYYARVKSIDKFGRNSSPFIEFSPVMTSFDISADVEAPAISASNVVSNIWKSSNNWTYDVDFEDPDPASGLYEVEIKITTGPHSAEPLIPVVDWSDLITSINAQFYTTDWTIPSEIWDLIPEGTSYVSLNLWDKALHTAETFDVFYILKDTTPPQIISYYTAPTGWWTDYPGPVTDFNFYDNLSALKKIYYSVSDSPGTGNANIINWTEITSVYGSTEAKNIQWDYNFSKLVNGVNYFSVKAVDIADNVQILIDTFTISKNVSGPTVEISTPGLNYLSTITYVSGYNYENDNKSVWATEISIKDKTSNLYWNGTDFISASRYWHIATDTYPYVLNVSLPLIEGRQYEIVARSSDVAGNYSSLYATHTFTYDNSPPSAGIVFPQNGSSVYSFNQIAGTAADAYSNISYVWLKIKNGSLSWSGSTWAGEENSVIANGQSNWTYDISPILKASLANGGTYYVTVAPIDTTYPPWQSNFYVYGSTFIYYDVIPPSAPYIISYSTNGPGSILLNISVPADDGNSGYIANSYYFIKKATYSEGVSSAEIAASYGIVPMLVSGTTQSFVINFLEPATTYYFGVYAVDDANNASELSNIFSLVTSPEVPNSIKGKVTQSSGQGIQGVIIEAYDVNNLLKSFSTTNAFGNYEISGIEAGNYTIRAIWSAEDIISWVSKSGIVSGSSNIDFKLSISYQLASIQGYIPSIKKTSSKISLMGINIEPRVEIYSRGRLIALAPIDEKGNFKVENLLPGTYSIRVFNGSEYSEMTEVRLSQGQEYFYRPMWAVVNKNKVYVYPNPSSEIANFYFETALSDFDAEVSVFDITGKLIKKMDKSKLLASGSGYEFKWNHKAEKIASGVYIYILRIKDNITGRKESIIKKMAVVK